MAGAGAISFDVFLSHTSSDKPAVAVLAEALRQRGLEPWLDVERVVPGVRFQSALGAGLAACRCFAVFLGAGVVGAWVPEELDAAIARVTTDRRFRVFLVLLPTAPMQFDASGLHPFLCLRTWVDLRSVTDPEVAGDLLARAVRGEPLVLSSADRPPKRDEAVCPYVGLRAFDSADAPWFFGRDADIQRIIERLRGSSFLVVLGASGSGKSSVVRAGLLPALANGLIDRSSSWVCRVLRPTATPLEELAGHVSALRSDLSANRIVDDLAGSDAGLRMLLAGRESEQEVVIVVDQAEELLTLCDDAEQRQAFVANLLHAAQPGGRVRVVVTLRSDFYARFADNEAFTARMAAHQHVLGDLGDQEIEAVITQPATLAGLRLEAGLVDQIVRDVRGRRSALPLLQYALRDLCERRRGVELTHEAYAIVGGVQGALARRADDVVAELDAAGDGPAVRRLMLELTQIGDGVADTQRPVLLGELASAALPVERLHRVTARLASARLVTTDAVDGDTRVEIAHEALIGSWPCLRDWIDEDRAELRTRRRIQGAARAWHEQGRPDELLYRGTPLAVALEQLDEADDDVPRIEAEFLATSSRHEDVARARARRTRRGAVIATIGALLTIAIITTGLSIVAGNARHRAETAQKTAEDNAARALARQAEALAPRQPALALAVAAEAVARDPSPAVAGALQVAHLAYGRALGHLWTTLPTAAPDATAIVASDPASDRFATASDSDSTIQIWDGRSGDKIVTLAPDEATTTETFPSVQGLAFSGDGRLIAAAGGDGAVRVWDAATYDVVATLDHNRNQAGDLSAGVLGVAFSPTERWLASMGDDDQVKVWDLAAAPGSLGNPAPTTTIPVPGVATMAFSPDGKSLATGGADGVIVWDRATGDDRTSFVPRTSPDIVGYSPDGRTLVVAEFGGSATLRDPTTGSVDMTLVPTHPGTDYRPSITAIAVSQNGRIVATGAEDGTVTLWDLATGTELTTLTHHTDPLNQSSDLMERSVNSLAFGQRDTVLATAGHDGVIKLWDLTRSDELITFHDPGTPDTNATVGIGFTHAGTAIVANIDRSHLTLWNADTGKPVASLPDPHAATGLAAIDLSPDGTAAAAANLDGTATLWNLETGASRTLVHAKPPRSDAEDYDGVSDVVFGPGGDTVATISGEGTAKLWDATTGHLVHTLTVTTGSHTNPVGLAFDRAGNILAVGDNNGNVTLWNPTTGDRLARFHTRNQGSLEALDLSPDGRYAALGILDGTTKLLDLTTGKTTTLASPAADLDLINSVAFSPDGSLVAAAHANGTVTLSNTKTSSTVATLTGHTGSVYALAFDPDGSRLATYGADGTTLIRRLLLSPSQACALVAQEVTRAELITALGEMRPQACTDLA